MKMHKRAFTLIELLVVIAIIAILAAILFPVFAQAKLAAKKAVDGSNIKQIGLGMLMYANDYDDKFCQSSFSGDKSSWDYMIYPYMKSGKAGKTDDGSDVKYSANIDTGVFRSPADDLSRRYGATPRSYALASNFPGWGNIDWSNWPIPPSDPRQGFQPLFANGSRSQSDMADVAGTFMIVTVTEENNAWANGDAGAAFGPLWQLLRMRDGNRPECDLAFSSPTRDDIDKAIKVCPRIYGDGYNYGYADAHVKYQKYLSKAVSPYAIVNGNPAVGGWTIDPND